MNNKTFLSFFILLAIACNKHNGTDIHESDKVGRLCGAGRKKE